MRAFSATLNHTVLTGDAQKNLGFNVKYDQLKKTGEESEII